MKKIKVICPVCGSETGPDRERLCGDLLECRNCGTQLEILSVSPLKCRILIEGKKLD